MLENNILEDLKKYIDEHYVKPKKKEFNISNHLLDIFYMKEDLDEDIDFNLKPKSNNIKNKEKNVSLEIQKDKQEHSLNNISEDASKAKSSKLSIAYNIKNIVMEEDDDASRDIVLPGNIKFDLDETFSETLLKLIDEKGISDAQCYNKANIDRRLFSKIRSDKYYKPSKTTVICFCIALELDLNEANNLLKKAGFILSHSSMSDVIVEYFIDKKMYDIYKIDEALIKYDQKTLIKY